MTNYYAWTYEAKNATFWTDTENPTVSSNIYDSNGNNVTSTYVYGDFYFSAASSSSMTFHIASKGDAYLPVSTKTVSKGSYTYNRNTALDIINDVPVASNLPETISSDTTIVDRLTTIDNALISIKQAIINKGQTPSGNITTYASAIEAIPTSAQPIYTSLNVTPSTVAQTLTAPTAATLYNTVIVSAVTSAIDSDITAANIKSGVNILGVTGTFSVMNGETRTVSVTNVSGNSFLPSEGKNAMTTIVATPNNKDLTITPATFVQTLTVSSGYCGNGPVTVNPVTAAIDSNIVPGNIKAGVTILGVTGTYDSVVPVGTKTISADGTYDVSNYAEAKVSVPNGTFVGIPREVDANGVYGYPVNNFSWTLSSGATDIGAYAMNYVFRGCTGLTSVDLSSLTTVSGLSAMAYAFQSCTALTTVDLSSLTSVRGTNTSAMAYAFNRCTALTTVDLSSLTTVSGTYVMDNAFNGCTVLTSVDLSSLTTVSGTYVMTSAFPICRGLTSVNLSSLTTVSGNYAMSYAFDACTASTSVDLSSLTTVSGSNAMSSAFRGCTALTSVTFTNLETIGLNTSSGDYAQFTSCFQNCDNLTTLTFPNLTAIYCTGVGIDSYGTFYYNNKIQKFYFPKLNTITYGTGASSSNQGACNYIFSSCSSLTEIHFGAANQAAIEATTGYSTKWGAPSTATIYFDL